MHAWPMIPVAPSQNYRQAGSANKGHGLKRALDPIFKLSNRWRDFVKCYNEQVTAEVVRRCVEARVGKLVYLQPVESKRDTRFLAGSGKVDGREDSTGWDWAQFGSRLNDKAKECGIHVEIKKCGRKQVRGNAA